MNVKTLQRLGATLVFASVAGSALAQSLGEHPAVVVAREWNSRGIDPNSFIVLPPAATQFLAAAPAEEDKVAASQHGTLLAQ
jgi:hypothetical protein